MIMTNLYIHIGSPVVNFKVRHAEASLCLALKCFLDILASLLFHLKEDMMESKFLKYYRAINTGIF